MQDRWQAILARYLAFSTRERFLILFAVVAVAYQLADLVILDRQFTRIDEINRTIAQDNRTMVAKSAELRALTMRDRDDPNARLREQVDRARDQVELLQARISGVTGEMITPQDMARFLEELLANDNELTMLRLRTLDARPLLSGADRTDSNKSRPDALHRHGFELEFSGGYLATLRYLQALESLPWRFFWDSVDYEVIDYPQSIVRLKLHTLSVSEDWIGV